MPPPLHIVHVVDSLEIGGLERVVTDLALAQVSHGDKVTVFSICNTGGFRSTLESHGIPVVVGDKHRTFDLTVLHRLRSVAASANIVHAHNFVPNYYAAAAMVGLFRAPLLVSTCHDMGMRLANRRLRWLYRLSLMRTARVAMVGRQVHDQFVGSGMVPSHRATTVLNGVPIEKFRNTPARRQIARQTLGIASDATVIGCVGRLVHLKNHAVLLSAFRQLVATKPALQLVLVGDGPLAGDLRRLACHLHIADNVHFLGAHPSVADLLPAFDIFALPSKTEGLSIALLEACATGIAAVATAVGGNLEVIADGTTGFLVPVDNEVELVSTLERLVGNPSERARIGTAAAAWVEKHASADSLRLAYDDFYRIAGAT